MTPMNNSHGTTAITLTVNTDDSDAPETAELLRRLGNYLVTSGRPEVEATRLALHRINRHTFTENRTCPWSETYVTGDYPGTTCPSSCATSAIETVRNDEPVEL